MKNKNRANKKNNNPRKMKTNLNKNQHKRQDKQEQNRDNSQVKNNKNASQQSYANNKKYVETKKQSSNKNNNDRKLTKAALRRKKAKRRVCTVLLVLLALIIGVVLSIVLLFKVTTIELQSPSGDIADTGVYTEELVIAKLGIELEENIFGFNEKEKEEALSTALPLLEQIDIVRKFPNTVYVRLAPAKESYTIKAGENWLILSSELRVISMDNEQPNLPLLMGATPVSWTTGEKLSFVEDAQDEIARQEAIAKGEIATDTQALPTRKETLDNLFLELEERDLLKDVTNLVFSGEAGIWFLYQDRISVEVGTIHELDYKLDIAKYILTNENGDGCAPTDTGELDVSNQSLETDVSAVFKQGAPNMPNAEEIAPEVTTQTPDTTTPNSTSDDISGQTQATPDPSPTASVGTDTIT